ncbi:nuclear transcription factor Y subunit C-1-like [Senna tora]|uniref:Nuclear transcription factor Y subunit C-1-like n=1 Tax=Senna tora TaxID=362788 RepID=A0A834TUG7_9FABA|nr:nuclear transcription factor Y subunit C-1-like [Senna tora]
MRIAGAYSGLLCGKSGAHTSLPLARIKKIMKKSGDDVKMISGDAPIVFSKACELFIQELTRSSWTLAIQAKRTTLHKHDVASAVLATDLFDFLIDLVSPVNLNLNMWDDVNVIVDEIRCCRSFLQMPRQQLLFSPAFA